MNIRHFLTTLLLFVVMSSSIVSSRLVASPNCDAVHLDVINKRRIAWNLSSYTLLARVPTPNLGVQSKLNGIPTATPVDQGNGFYRVNVFARPGDVWFFQVQTLQGLFFDCELVLP